MTLGEWVRGRTPVPPSRLLARIEEVLGERVDVDASEPSTVTTVCLDAAVGLLETLLARPSLDRACALDLLVADALTTYAFEAASERPARLAECGTVAMRRFALTARA